MKNLLNKLFLITLVLSTQTLFAQIFNGGTGSSSDPYTILDTTHLKNFAASVNGGTDYSGEFIRQDADLTLHLGNWAAIGAEATPFKGNYDGNNHKIAGIIIDARTTAYQGLFGHIDGAVIKNLGVEGATISGSNYTGGLVGKADGASSITNCYSTVSDTGSGGYLGGLVGSATGTISDCYSRGSVTARVDCGLIGGLIGSAVSLSVTNCYSTDTVTVTGGSYLYGGLIGYDGGSNTFSNCFWDVTTSGQSSSAGGTGELTADMKLKSTYTGWSGTTWKIDEAAHTINGGYPFLAWQDAGGVPLPVEFTSFTSVVNKNSVTLNWSTATEVNNYGFEIERRIVKSEQQTVNSWQKIGFVQGAGTSNSPHMYSYSDASLVSGNYAYRLKQIDNDGTFKYSQSIELEVKLAPVSIGLSQNYPNPFNPSTQISFCVPNTQQAKLVVYNILGQPVVTLFDGVAVGQQAYQVNFDALKLASGVYFYKLETPSRIDVRRMQLLK